MTDTKEEWGPWIEHDGKGCPVEGFYGQGLCADGYEFEKVFGSWEGPSEGVPVDCWDWSCFNLQILAWEARVIRYRIRIPRALIELRRIAENPAPVPEKETA